MIDEGQVRSINVAVMEVPCCGGLVRLAQQAAESASRSVPVRVQVVSLRGDLVHEEEIGAA